MIAHLIRDDGQEARFHLRTLTIPPSRLVRKGRCYALQPDFTIPEAGFEIMADYRECYAPNIDMADPMNEAQISYAGANLVPIEDQIEAAADAELETLK